MNLHVTSYPLIASLLILALYGILYPRLRKLNLDLLAFLLIIASYSMYLRAFLVDDFTLREVFRYSNSGMPLWLKLAASWASIGGSFLLWTFYTVLIAIAYRIYYWKKKSFNIRVMRLYYILIIALGFLSLTTGAFDSLQTPYKLTTGLGLNPILRSFWMLFHPVFTFAGYAFSLAFAIEVLISNHKKIEKILALLAWLNLSIGIISGAAWAYSVLGWGGYWAWDPVETAELVPWLTLTAYFHSLQLASRGGEKLAAGLTGFFIFYASFMTKAGAQFTASVHTFQEVSSSSLLIAVHFVLGLIFLVLYFRNPGELKFSFKHGLTQSSFSLAYISLILLSLTCFTGIFVPVAYAVITGNLISIGPEYYNTSCAPFVYLFLLALTGCSLRKLINFKQFSYIVAAVITCSSILVLAGVPTGNWIADMLIPASFTGLMATLLSLLLDLKSQSARLIGISLMHFAIPLILLGVALNAALTSGLILQARLNEYVETPYGFSIKFENFSVRASDQIILYRGHLVPEGAFGDFNFKIKFSDNEVDLLIPARAFFVYGCGGEPGIISKGINDIYISIVHADLHNRLKSIIINNAFFGGDYKVESVYIEVKYNPYIGLVWAGCAILVLGEVIATIAYILKISSPSQKKVET